MPTRLIVDEQNQLQQVGASKQYGYPAFITVAVNVFSFIFHLIFIPVYLSWFLVYQHQFLFSGFSEWDKTNLMLQFFVMYTFFPVVTTLLLKALGFIKLIFLKTQRDRIIPYVVLGIYYFWVWYVLRNQLQFPKEIVTFRQASFIASSIGLIANIYLKISMHAIAVGVMCTFMALLAFTDTSNITLYVLIAFLITGIVCLLSPIDLDVNQRALLIGLFIGIVSQLIAQNFA